MPPSYPPPRTGARSLRFAQLARAGSEGVGDGVIVATYGRPAVIADEFKDIPGEPGRAPDDAAERAERRIGVRVQTTAGTWS